MHPMSAVIGSPPPPAMQLHDSGVHCGKVSHAARNTSGNIHSVHFNCYRCIHVVGFVSIFSNFTIMMDKYLKTEISYWCPPSWNELLLYLNSKGRGSDDIDVFEFLNLFRVVPVNLSCFSVPVCKMHPISCFKL